MPALRSHIMPQSDAYRQNYAALVEFIGRLCTLEDRTYDKSEASRIRFEQRGQLLPRDQFDRLLDAGAPFPELSILAGFRLDHADPARSISGGGFIADIGWVSGARAMIIVDGTGIDAGVVQPVGIEGFQCAQAIALEQKLPLIHLIESAGANPLTYRMETFIRDGSGFYWLARLPAAGIPVTSVMHGSSTAGGACMPGLSGYVVMVRDRTRALLAGLSLLKAATGEITTEEKLGGTEMHATTSGLVEYLAEDDADALRIAHEPVAALDWNRDVPVPNRPYVLPRFDAEELFGIVLTDHRKPLDIREVITRSVDGSDFLELKPDYGSGTITGHVVICGIRVGVITDSGPLDPVGVIKVVYFIQMCCRSDIPLLYLQNTTGFVVDKALEQASTIEHGSETIQAMANITMSRITTHCGASFGADNYGMSGRGFFPDFCFSRSNAKTAVMGAGQTAGTMAMVMVASM